MEAFDWNLLSGPLGLESRDAAFDKLFAFGIDPVGTGLPADTPGDWPTIAKTEKYKSTVRERLDEDLKNWDSGDNLREPLLADGTLLHVAIEHRLMHAETLAYLLHNLPLERKIPQPAPISDPRPAPEQRWVTIPAGAATLGQSRDARKFGWDNEFDTERIDVPSFSIGTFPVTNAEYLEFIRACGYEDSRYWRPQDWEWKRQVRLEHPHFWLPRSSSGATDPDTQWEYRSMFGIIPLPQSWPVYVSYAEAAAFAPVAANEKAAQAEFAECAQRLEVAKQCGKDVTCYAKALDDKTLVKQEKAAFMLAHMGKPGLDPLVAKLSTREPIVRLAVLYGIARIADKSSTAAQKALDAQIDNDWDNLGGWDAERILPSVGLR